MFIKERSPGTNEEAANGQMATSKQNKEGEFVSLRD